MYIWFAIIISYYHSGDPELSLAIIPLDCIDDEILTGI